MDNTPQFYYTNVNSWKCFTAPHLFSEIQIKNEKREIILRIPQPYPITQIGDQEQKNLIKREIDKINENKPYKLNCLV